MRIVVWNMSHWQKTAEQRAAAWQAVRDLGADVALLQETVPPDGAAGIAYREIGGTRRWGSAVWGISVDVEPITHVQGRANKEPEDLLRTWPGSIAVARVAGDDLSLTFVSLYGVIDNGYADTTVNRQLSDLAPLFDHPVLARNLVLGGDLNITTQWVGREAPYRAWEAAILFRIEAFGLVDCLDLMRPDGPLVGCDCADGDRCRHIRTQYHPTSERPWQNDYVFATKALTTAPGVLRAEVVDDPSLRTLSDHLPMVLELATTM